MDLGVLILFPIAWWGSGQVLRRRFGLGDEVLGEHLLSVGLGVGLHSVLMTVALLLGAPALVATLVFLVPGATAAAFFRREARAGLRGSIDAFRGMDPADRVLTLVVGIFLALLLGSALCPPYEYDVLAYHLPEVRHYFETGSLAPIPYLKETFYPKSITVLYVSGRSLGTFAAARVVHALLGCALALAVGRIGLLLGRVRWALVSMLVFLSIRETNYVFPSALVDIGFGFLQVLSAVHVVRAVTERSLRSAALAGVFGGLSVAAKFMGAGLLGASCVVLLVAFARPGRWRTALAAPVVCGLAALVVYGPWFYRNHEYLGETLHPLRPARIERMGDAEGAVAETAGGRLGRIGGRYHVRETTLPLSLLALTFDAPEYRHPLNPAYLGFLPVGLLWLLVGRNRDARLLLLTLLALLAYGFWFKTYPHIRYAQGPFAILAVGAAAGFAFLTAGGRPVRYVATAVMALFLLAGVAKGGVDAAFSWRRVLGLTGHDDYLAARIDSYRFLERVRESANGRVLSSDDRIFYLGPQAVPVSFRNTFWRPDMTPERFGEWLAAQRIDFVAVYARRSLWPEMGAACRVLAERGVLAVVFADGDGTLYRVE